MKKAIVLVADGSEELEAVTIIDVLRRGGIDVNVSSVTGGKLVQCANGTYLQADSVLSDATELGAFDLLVLPGGSAAAETYSKDPKVQSAIKFFESNHKFVAVICASTLAIHAAGAFPGCKATSYPSLRSRVDSFYDYQEQNVVVDGKLITSRGPATAMAFALTILEVIVGTAKRDSVASGLLYH